MEGERSCSSLEWRWEERHPARRDSESSRGVEGGGSQQQASRGEVRRVAG